MVVCVCVCIYVSVWLRGERRGEKGERGEGERLLRPIGYVLLFLVEMGVLVWQRGCTMMGRW